MCPDVVFPGRTVVNHLQVEGLSFVDVVEVFHGDDEAQLQDGQTYGQREENTHIHTYTGVTSLDRGPSEGGGVLPCSMLALASAKLSRLASSRSAGVMAGLAADTRLRHNIWRRRERRGSGVSGGQVRVGHRGGGSYQQHVH